MPPDNTTISTRPLPLYRTTATADNELHIRPHQYALESSNTQNNLSPDEEARILLAEFMNKSRKAPAEQKSIAKNHDRQKLQRHMSMKPKRQLRESSYSSSSEAPRARIPRRFVSSENKENVDLAVTNISPSSEIPQKSRRSGRPISRPRNYYAKIRIGEETTEEETTKVTIRKAPVAVRKNEPTRYSKEAPRKPSSGKLLRDRELGLCRVSQRQLHKEFSQNLKISKRWKGASNDVLVLTWSPKGTQFAVGAAAESDDLNMDYNRGNNLLLGDLTRNSLKELPDHWVQRPRRRNLALNTTADRRLFMSVTAIQWYEDMLLTASYDHTVKLWDVANYDQISCRKTLRHRSKVNLMARSHFYSNLVATGTLDDFTLWDLEDNSSSPLEAIKGKQAKNIIEYTPTALVWGQTNVTKKFLVAGMSEKVPNQYITASSGQLAVWTASETSMAPIQISPSAQNIFDIKWHPTMPIFVTGSSRPKLNINGAAKDTRSVVRIYEPFVSKRSTMELDCPALDMNDVSFCPVNPNYVSASCTDGITYVWDIRDPSEVLHKLEHGYPINQINEEVSREQADVGVRVALWGNEIDAFYTGASDGVLKRWNILRSPEDTLVENTASLKEEIMCGTFSDDKTNLLIGDAAGGIHVLSSGPFWNTDECDMNLESAPEPASSSQPLSSSTGADPESESGVEIANRLLSSGALERHPVFGVGQGPNYKGPYARWARRSKDNNVPMHVLAKSPLTPEVQQCQLSGLPVDKRPGLDNHTREEIKAQIRLARTRNYKRNKKKRKRKHSSHRNDDDKENTKFISLISDDEGCFQPSKAEPEIIDLTMDSDSDSSSSASQPPDPFDIRAFLKVLAENLEEDYWWPDSGHIDANINDGDV
ncbi:hypothetical protein ASPZODRAFT_134254 [Penicilliopsis zonata CBS 506.65]|uniref:Uncharacterized protein n=1 Tax=Penicilliopsis zonata CBS 506.65 TaxID=1073090 RepID=A0A1L9SCB5_9EURO|nr:hypothetical protein ASPZODRAFT_134254 [Penicilliopsis zonata CBS 506.65]OJJ44855.1 hypothetical protein ASPZODRAFT_134254 [Penicilliopsis zonata CBS 506.65]